MGTLTSLVKEMISKNVLRVGAIKFKHNLALLDSLRACRVEPEYLVSW